MKKNNLRKLSVQVIGNKCASNVETDKPSEKTDEDVTKDFIEMNILNIYDSSIQNIDDFRRSLFVYPVTKTLIDFPSASIINDNRQ